MNIDQWVARPKLFALEDGVGELMLGLNAAVTGSAFAVSFTLPKGSPQAQYSTFVVQAEDDSSPSDHPARRLRRVRGAAPHHR
jgi:hypothetical protein